jgi:O-antigen ligase
MVRPYELIPALSSYKSMAMMVGGVMIALYGVTQLLQEGTLTARVREIQLVLLLAAAGLAAVPLAIYPDEAWATWCTPFARAVAVFIIIVNVVRDMRRLERLLWLALAVSVYLSFGAVSDYLMGRTAVEEYRVEGRIGGMFENPNELALHLVTMIPIAVGFFLAAPRPLGRFLYGAAAVVMVAGTTVTYSRGGFLGLVALGVVLAYRLGRWSKATVSVVAVLGLAAMLLFAPAGYGNRMGQILSPGADPTGSASLRLAQLIQSVRTTLINPLFGIGMGNFHAVAVREQGTHNSYTQVSSEMGLPALYVYCLFLLAPLGGLREIERRTGPAQPNRFYSLAVGLQASLISFMICSFFAHVAYHWYLYYLMGYAVCLRRIYQSERGKVGC